MVGIGASFTEIEGALMVGMGWLTAIDGASCTVIEGGAGAPWTFMAGTSGRFDDPETVMLGNDTDDGSGTLTRGGSWTFIGGGDEVDVCLLDE